MERRMEIILGILMLGFGSIYFFDTFNINTRGNTVDSRTLPFILSGLIFVLSAAQLRSALKSDIKNKEKKQKDFLSVVKVAFSILCYVILFESLGFIIATALFLLAMFILLTPETYEPNYKLYTIISIAVSMFIYVTFRYGLDVLLPQGLITVI